MNKNRFIYVLTGIILVQFLIMLFMNSDLQYQRKAALESSQYCIKYTSEIITNGSIDLVREKAAHEKDILSANTNIDDLVNRYNDLVKKYNKLVTKPIDELLVYSFRVIKS